MAKQTTKKTTKGSKKKLPDVVHLILCDGVTRDPNTGKTTLYGVFDKFVIEEVSHSSPPFSVFALLQGGAGTYRISFHLLDPDGSSRPITQGVSEVEFAPDRKLEGIARIGGIKFERLGKYYLVLKGDGKKIGRPLPFTVEVAKRKT